MKSKGAELQFRSIITVDDVKQKLPLMVCGELFFLCYKLVEQERPALHHGGFCWPPDMLPLKILYKYKAVPSLPLFSSDQSSFHGGCSTATPCLRMNTEFANLYKTSYGVSKNEPRMG